MTSYYNAPKHRVHRGFHYLDDETVINSLSAVESGKVDEVVAKVASAKEGGLSGKAGFTGLGIEGGKKSSTELEEQIVKVRTRFSIFEIWYQNLIEKEALGTFSGWNDRTYSLIRPGDTIEIRANVQIVPFQVLARLYFWYAEQAKIQGTPFSLKGEELKTTKETERIFKTFLGDDQNGVLTVIHPIEGSGPPIYGLIDTTFLIGNLGDLYGEFTVLAQAEHSIPADESLPALRLTRQAPPTKMEMDTLKLAVTNFSESAQSFGLDWGENEAELLGPALSVKPIAIYR
ncbi:hypothetical protein [Rhodococcus sp. 077-4]|uniref:DUF6414 family protein n=1 Tax=Rhodococcus sp. 077-4 TaxID=2789271 RepID=UPI0039F61905